MLEMQSQVTKIPLTPHPLPQRLAPLASFGPSTRWMSPPRKKSCLRACTTPTALSHPTPPPSHQKNYVSFNFSRLCCFLICFTTLFF